MTRRKTTLIVILAALLAIEALATPAAIRLGLFYWIRAKARRTYASLPADAQRNLNTTPTLITLPPPNPGPLAAIESQGFIFRVPPPLPGHPEDAMHGKTLAILGYPKFTVNILKPFSTASSDTVVRAVYHQDSFEHQAETYHARPVDLGTQPDLTALRHVVELLADKPTRAALWIHFAQFQQPDHGGFIMAIDPNGQRFHAEIRFPATGIACGMYFEHSAGVSATEVQQFLATLQIEPETRP